MKASERTKAADDVYKPAPSSPESVLTMGSNVDDEDNYGIDAIIQKQLKQRDREERLVRSRERQAKIARMKKEYEEKQQSRITVSPSVEEVIPDIVETNVEIIAQDQSTMLE